MAGLLAWAADVVGAHGNNHELEEDRIPIVFTDDQQKYVQELDSKASSLSRTIQDLRLRLPPPDISQRLPHLLAHSIASNAALALQLNAHSATKEQAQLREVTLQEENAEYEKAILNCENNIHERIQEADLLLRKLQTEQALMEELENAETAMDGRQHGNSGESVDASETTVEAGSDAEAAKSDILEKLDNKKKELSSLEEIVQDLDKRWMQVQENALKQPAPAQREKLLDKQLHSLIEQLAAKQVDFTIYDKLATTYDFCINAQAEGLVSEIHLKEMELERLNGLLRRLESSNVEGNTARNRFGRSTSDKGSAFADFIVDKLPYSTGGRTEHQQKLMFLRSAFVVYILFLHIVVFIKLSF
ncbi:hypothetical protein POTOM_055218 [Populus tomentosa]|uniref:Uncharacterized protein n=1 Tax=Populus tomentosa TaxID=118781 RepID=A0A8X7XWD7_POPTO|nr:hypothetical protein POTOM_055218 [Populus tomentosa]